MLNLHGVSVYSSGTMFYSSRRPDQASDSLNSFGLFMLFEMFFGCSRMRRAQTCNDVDCAHEIVHCVHETVYTTKRYIAECSIVYVLIIICACRRSHLLTSRLLVGPLS